jgi:transcriptional regulator with XRE-family HTH domain
MTRASGLAKALRLARVAKGMSQVAVAAAVGKTRQTISSYEREHGGTTPDEETLEQLARLYGTTVAALRGAARGASAPPAYTPNAALARRLPPEAYEVVLRYLERMEAAGCTAEQINEAERLMIDGAFNKLNTRDPRDRTVDELITDIDAAWAFITLILAQEGIRP